MRERHVPHGALLEWGSLQQGSVEIKVVPTAVPESVLQALVVAIAVFPGISIGPEFKRFPHAIAKHVNGDCAILLHGR